MRSKTRALALFIAVLLAGCSSIVGGDAEMKLSFRYQATPAWTVPSLSTTSRDGKLIVFNGMTTPVPCYRLEGSAGKTGRTIELVVRAERAQGGCTFDIGTFQYLAELENLQPGSYTLRLWHEYPGTELETEMREVQVTHR